MNLFRPAHNKIKTLCLLLLGYTVYVYADTINSSIIIRDVSNNKVTTTTVGPKQALDVNVASGGGSGPVSIASPIPLPVVAASPFPVTFSSPLPVTFPTPVPVTQSTSPWVVSGTVNATQSGSWTTGRTWTLLNTTDSVNVGNFPSTFGVTQSTSPWVVSGTVAATQSGAWTTGRTWNLSSGADSVSAVQSGTWTVQQGSAPWSVSQSGTWNLNNISGTISLPAGAATAANQTNGSQKTQVVDGSGSVVGPVQTISGTNYAPVVLAASATPGSATVSRSIQIAGTDGTNARTISTDTTGSPLIQGNIASGVTESGNPVSISGIYNSTVPGFTNGQRGELQIGPRGSLITTNNDGFKATYSASVQNLSVAASASDIFSICGSGTKTIRVLNYYITATQTTAGSANIRLRKYSTADTGGTSTNPTIVPYDSNFAAGTATVTAYTANPTLGTSLGVMRAEEINVVPQTTNNTFAFIDWHFGDHSDSSLVLRGTAQCANINLAGTTITGGSFTIFVAWTEE